MREVSLISLLCLSFLLQSISAEENFLVIYKKGNNYFLEIPAQTLGRDILTATTILQGAAENNRSSENRFGYGGDAVYNKMIRLLKRNNAIDIVAPDITMDLMQPTIYKNYNESATNSIIETFPIESSQDSTYTIDVTRFLSDDNALVSLKGAKEEMKLGNYDASQSYITDVKSYKENIIIRSLRTYSYTEGNNSSNKSWVAGVSWFLLPEKPMTPRILDPRVGYFGMQVNGSLIRKDVNEKTVLANRWRLEPKEKDLNRYLRGELVEPQKQIVYYIDRATPEFLVPYFIRAVEAWNVAFESAGFKNAITAKLASLASEDSTYSEDDMRFSLISYKASPIPNAYGPMVVDPRSGEVLNSHVAIFHSVLQLLQRWYFANCSAADIQAREFPLSDNLMGELAAMVVTHEVGHTLGLMHNFAGSTLYKVDSLRDINFVRKNGIGASVMDYQRFDYVAQPNDGFSGVDFMPRIGIYDKYVIDWGYRFFEPNYSPSDIANRQQEWVTNKRKESNAYVFVNEKDYYDPRIQSEDSGDDQIAANSLTIKNLMIEMQNLLDWNPKSDADYFVLRKRYLSILSHYDNCMGHVLKFVGGRYTDNPLRTEDLPVYEPVSKAKQKEAMEFLYKNIFTEPTWLFREDIMEKTNADFETFQQRSYSSIIGKLVHRNQVLNKNMQIDPTGYSAEEMLTDMKAYLFDNKLNRKSLSRFDRMLQNTFVTELTISAENSAYFTMGFAALAKQILVEISATAIQAQKSQLSFLDRSHYRAISDFIRIWETGTQKNIANQEASK